MATTGSGAGLAWARVESARTRKASPQGRMDGVSSSFHGPRALVVMEGPPHARDARRRLEARLALLDGFARWGQGRGAADARAAVQRVWGRPLWLRRGLPSSRR